MQYGRKKRRVKYKPKKNKVIKERWGKGVTLSELKEGFRDPFSNEERK